MPKPKISPTDLPQTSETWFFMTHRLRVWITPEDAPPSRPLATVIMDARSGFVLAVELFEEAPTPKVAEKLLRKTMLTPPKERKINPHRPRQVHFDDGPTAKAMLPKLLEWGIDVKHRSAPPEMYTELFEGMEEHLRGGVKAPGLLNQKGVSVRQVESLFHAAAEFYRAQVWVTLSDEDVLSIRLPSMRAPNYGIVMGQAGISYGLVLRRTWEDVLELYQAGEPGESLPGGAQNSLFFDDITLLPFDDSEAVEHYRLEIAAEDAYPIFMLMDPDDDIPLQRPSREDLTWYEAALRAIPIFVSQHLKKSAGGGFEACVVEIPVTLSSGQTIVQIIFPAGKIPKSLPGDVSSFDEEDFARGKSFDRRSMEGAMMKLGRDQSSESFVAPAVQEAQEIMYLAWSEENPAKRIALAHEALKVSPDCADAYVLLAEELADSPLNALSYYELGINAGLRALGEEIFTEHADHFWLILETRPYMRALEGKADTFWNLDRKGEACKIYEELLILNPDDNQGVRYDLLSIYLQLDLDAKARKLIRQYNEPTAIFLFTRALLDFRKSGASPTANRALAAALKNNPHVSAYLRGKKRIPSRLPDSMGIGDDSEALIYAAQFLNDWRRTPGAVAWLAGQSS